MYLQLVPAVMLADEDCFEGATSDLKLVPIALAEDGWAEKPECSPGSVARSGRPAGMRPGDLVLYRCEGALVPAVLIEAAGGGCWLARDSRHMRSLIYLAAESIATRLASPDLLEEAA